MRLLLTSNDPRSRFLFDEIDKLVDVVGYINFDDLDLITKACAGALSWLPDRTMWRRAYYMHPLVQRRRAHVLARKMELYRGRADAVLMWSSWFRPPGPLPFFQYFDESYAPPHGLPFSPWRRASFRMQAAGYRSAAGLFCFSEWSRDQILAWHRNCASKAEVVDWGPCGVNLSDEEIPESERKPIVLHVSNDPHRKGVDYLIDTAKIVRASLPQAQFVVIGRMPEGWPTVSRTDGVSFLGEIHDKEELAHHFRRASVFFLPHRYDRSPHVAVEAMSAGLPIVGSHQGGLTQLIEGQDTGFLIGVGDVGGYALALDAMLREPELRARMGAAARELMRRRYTWSHVAEKMVAGITATMQKPGD